MMFLYFDLQGRSLTPPQASRHSSNRSHHETGVASTTVAQSSTSNWNGPPQSRSQQDEYRNKHRPRSPGSRQSCADANLGGGSTVGGQIQQKKRSSSIDRNEFRRHDSRDAAATTSEYYGRNATAAESSSCLGRDRLHTVNLLPSRDVPAQKKPRTPPSPSAAATKKKRARRSCSTSSDETSSTAGDVSTNGSSSSSSSEDSSSDTDNNSAEGGAAGGGAGVGGSTKKETLEPSANNNTNNIGGGGVPTTSASANFIQNSSAAAAKDPSPDIQKLQRERAQLLQMLETLDGEEKSDPAAAVCLSSASASAGSSKKNSADNKRTPTLITEIFDMSWVEKVRKRGAGGDQISTTFDTCDEKTNKNSSSFLPELDDVGDLQQRIRMRNRLTSNLSDTVRSMDVDESSLLLETENNCPSSSSSAKIGVKTTDFLEADCITARNNLAKTFDSIVVKQEKLQEQCANEIINKQCRSTSASESSASAAAVPNVVSTLAAANNNNNNPSNLLLLTSSGSKNELATPARASLSQKSRKIPLELSDGEQTADPRTAATSKLNIVVDLPIPHFVKKSGFLNVGVGGGVITNTVGVSSGGIVHQTSTSASPLKPNRPELKVETSQVSC